MKKKTKAGQKRLNNLLIILLLTAILLIMSTYAWFTANRTVNIDQIDVKVATSSGLQISADGITWKTVLEYQDLKDAYQTYAGSVNQLPKLMAPVSTVLKETNGKLEMFYGDINTDMDTTSDTYGQYLITSKSQTEKDTYREGLQNAEDEYAAGYYMAFDIFLKDTVAVDNLYMTGSALETGEVKKGIENAARIALIQGATEADVDNSSAIQNLSTKDGKVMMWEPNADTHTEKAIINGSTLGWTADTLAQVGAPTIKYDGVGAEFTTGIELSQGTNTANPTLFKPIDLDNTGAKAIWDTTKTSIPSLSIPDGMPAGATKFRVYIWIEGQDIDCENNASGTDFEVNLSFSLDPFTASTTPETP